MKALLELQHIPTLPWLFIFLKADEVLIERHENFVKSTFRNRCEVTGPNGKQTLSVPVKGGKDHHQLYKEVRVADDYNWRKDHFQSLCSNYRRSPFFEYYEDRIEALYESDAVTLYDLNLQWLQFLLQAFKIDKPFVLTEQYQKQIEGVTDYRSTFVPGLQPQVSGYSSTEYMQPFSARTGFIPNLSSLDLLFCEGPKGIALLRDQL